MAGSIARRSRRLRVSVVPGVALSLELQESLKRCAAAAHDIRNVAHRRRVGRGSLAVPPLTLRGRPLLRLSPREWTGPTPGRRVETL